MSLKTSPGGRVRPSRVRRAPTLPLVALAIVVAALVGQASSDRTRFARGELPIRMVLSSSSPASAVKTLGSTSLYAKPDPWSKYLASESRCPGGERTDLPRASQARTLVCLVNFARKRYGLRELSVVPSLNEASIRKARAILRCGRFAHNPCGGDWETTLRSSGYAGGLGENLYLASGPWAAPRPAVDAWLNSAPHRENLFSTEWREQGLAVIKVNRLGDRRDVSVWVSLLGKSGG